MDNEAEPPRERLTTGVPGLDLVLNGGLLRRGVYMISGQPGRGKTILANQISFHHANEGGRVVYTTLLAESHERMLFNLEQLSFFAASRIGQQISYVSAFATLEEGGLKALVELLRREARSRNATLLVVDGFVAAEETAESRKDLKKLIHELQAHASLVGCTILLLTSGSTEPIGPEHTMVDGVFELYDNHIGRRAERELVVKKLRGTSHLRGGHAFQITQSGIVVYPRLESLLRDPPADDPCKTDFVSTGIASLDRVLNGGLRCASSSVVFGPTGTGKTSIGLHFLSAATREEPALHFGFYEAPARILLKSRVLGLDIEGKQKRGEVELMWHAPTERVLDALGNRLVNAIRERRVKRLFLDGVDGFLKAAAHPDRLSHFLSALTNELRIQGVTGIYTAELQDLFSTQVGLPMHGISSLVENVFLIRFVEQEARLRRAFSVVKMRDTDYDPTVRELRITSNGAELGDPVSIQSGGGEHVDEAQPFVRESGTAEEGFTGETSAQATRTLNMISVLVVDDEIGIAEALRDVLGDEGFRVQLARHGQEGLKSIADQRPDIILDYMMPIMDGCEMWRALQADESLRSIPVLMMSATFRKYIPGDCKPEAFLRKPFDIDVLLSEIRRLLDSRENKNT